MVSHAVPVVQLVKYRLGQVVCKVVEKLAGPLASKGCDQQYKVPVAADC